MKRIYLIKSKRFTGFQEKNRNNNVNQEFAILIYIKFHNKINVYNNSIKKIIIITNLNNLQIPHIINTDEKPSAKQKLALWSLKVFR